MTSAEYDSGVNVDEEPEYHSEESAVENPKSIKHMETSADSFNENESSSDESGKDVESGEEKEEPLASIEPSVGWIPFPEVKLASWEPENEKQWAAHGSKIAFRNLLVSIPNLFAGFGVWLSWSVIVAKIQKMHDEDPTLYSFPDYGSPTGSEYKALLYSLPAIAGLSGGTLRIPNSFMTQIVGGRNVIFHTSLILAVPMIMIAAGLKNTDVPFSFLLVCATLSGAGGGAFASSMSNMSFLYPKAKQGMALGYNGGLGNLGVSATQLLLPVFMGISFGKSSLSSTVDIKGWPNHAGWFWWPICIVSALACFFWMSNNPRHGNHAPRNDKLWNVIYFYWLEITGFIAAFISVITLVYTRDNEAFTSSAAGKIGQKVVLVCIAIVLEHLFMYYLSPGVVKKKIRSQARMFKDKHTWIMTYLYIMSFGSFIGFSGAFPKLIQDLFGYIQVDGCTDSEGVFTRGGDQEACDAAGGVWGQDEIVNPNAPNVFYFSWIGAAVGSLIRPVGGILADKWGGARVTMILIVWCTIACVCTGILVQKTYDLTNPEKNFGYFVFLFINMFFCVGAMNGTTFRTIGVLFCGELAGPVLGWSSAIASYGAFVIPAFFGVAIGEGAAQVVFYGLAIYYLSCAFLNFWYYVRPGCERPGV